jgi:hypothetical protein
MKKSGAVSKRVLKADVSERPLKCAKSDEQENSSPSNGPAREARENTVPAVMMRTSGASGSSSDRTKKKMVIKPYSVRRRSNKLLSMRPSRARSIIYWKARRLLLLAYSRLVLTLRTQIKPKIPESFEDDAWEKLKAAVDAVCCRAAVHRSRELAHPPCSRASIPRARSPSIRQHRLACSYYYLAQVYHEQPVGHSLEDLYRAFATQQARQHRHSLFTHTKRLRLAALTGSG